MRKTSAFSLLLLAGCASGHPQEQQRIDIRQAPEVVSATVPDSVAWVQVQGARMRLATLPCETNDPMPTGNFRSFMVPRSMPMPNSPALRSLPYIPNACPVTVGPLASKPVPTVHLRGRKTVPQPQTEPPRQP
jgi:hypothetical protein